MYITKGYWPLHFTMNIWLRILGFLAMWSSCVFKQTIFSNEVISNMVEKTLEQHVFPTFVETTIIITIFDLWMSWSGFNTFDLVINYINKKCKLCHVTIGIFKIHETYGLPWLYSWKTYLFNLVYVTRSYHMWKTKVPIWTPSQLRWEA